MARFGVTEEQVAAFRFDESYRAMMKFEVERTRKLFDEGAGLLPLLAPPVRRQISLFEQGGRAILRAIERQGYDTLSTRPRLSKVQKGKLVMRALGLAIAQKLGGGGPRAKGAA
jgi:phytoene/squalene synthetase